MTDQLVFKSAEESYAELAEFIILVMSSDRRITANIKLIAKFAREAMKICWPHREKICWTPGFEVIYFNQLALRGDALRHAERLYRMAALLVEKNPRIKELKPRAKLIRKAMISLARGYYWLHEDKAYGAACMKIINNIYTF